MEEVSTNEERINFLTENYDLSRKNALALLLAEMGFSHSGIATKLSVKAGTAKKYLATLESEIGEGVTETVPKSVRYPTYPGDVPKSEVPYSGDVVDVSPSMSGRDVPLNRGVPLSEIDPSLMSLGFDFEA